MSMLAPRSALTLAGFFRTSQLPRPVQHIGAFRQSSAVVMKTSAQARRLHLATKELQNENNNNKNTTDTRTRLVATTTLLSASLLLLLLTQQRQPVANEAVTAAVDDGNNLIEREQELSERVREIMARLDSAFAIFNFFASIQDSSNGVRYMTADDLVRCLTMDVASVINAGEKGSVSRSSEDVKQLAADSSMLLEMFDINHDGRISFQEYSFFMSLLNTSVDDYKIAFRMLDADGNGELDLDEFYLFLRASSSASLQPGSTGTVNKDKASSTSSTIPPATQQPLRPRDSNNIVYEWFGRDLKKKLSFAKFAAYMESVQQRVHEAQFNRYDRQGDGFISARDYALFLVTRSNPHFIPKLLRRTYRIHKDSEVEISKKEFLDTVEFFRKIEDVIVALRLLSANRQELQSDQLQQVAERIAGVSLNKKLTSIMFTVFGKKNKQTLKLTDFVEYVMPSNLAHTTRQKPSLFNLFVECLQQTE